MVNALKSVVMRNADTLIEDAAGCLALIITLYVGLMLPGLV